MTPRERERIVRVVEQVTYRAHGVVKAVRPDAAIELIRRELAKRDARVRKLVSGYRTRFQLEMDLEVLDGSEQSVIEAGSKMEACDDLLAALRGRKGKR